MSESPEPERPKTPKAVNDDAKGTLRFVGGPAPTHEFFDELMEGHDLSRQRLARALSTT